MAETKEKKTLEDYCSSCEKMNSKDCRYCISYTLQQMGIDMNKLVVSNLPNPAYGYVARPEKQPM